MFKILFLTVVAVLSSNVVLGAEEKGKNTYGVAESNPIQLGSPTGRSPAGVLHAYMDRLQGPKGEKVTYRRGGERAVRLTRPGACSGARAFWRSGK